MNPSTAAYAAQQASTMPVSLEQGLIAAVGVVLMVAITYLVAHYGTKIWLRLQPVRKQ